MPSGKYNIKLEQGSKFAVQFTWLNGDKTPVDLTDYTAKIQIRETKESTDILYDSTVTDDISLGDVTGIITWTLTTAQTTQFTFDSAFYDLELTKDAETTRFIEGRVYLSKEVTRT